jgi:hypothetical protein
MVTRSRYTPPVLNDHEVAYKGKRYWVIAVTAENPLEWVDAPAYDFAIYDKSIGYVMAAAKRMANGQLDVVVPAQVTEQRFEAGSFREAAAGAAQCVAYLDRHGWG